jgi:hypothetical protein
MKPRLRGHPCTVQALTFGANSALTPRSRSPCWHAAFSPHRSARPGPARPRVRPTHWKPGRAPLPRRRQKPRRVRRKLRRLEDGAPGRREDPVPTGRVGVGDGHADSSRSAAPAARDEACTTSTTPRCTTPALKLVTRPSPPSDSNRKPLHYKPKRGRAPAYASMPQHIKTPAYNAQRRSRHVSSRRLASARARMLVCAECARCGGASAPQAWGPGDDCRERRRAGSRDGARPGR